MLVALVVLFQNFKPNTRWHRSLRADDNHSNNSSSSSSSSRNNPSNNSNPTRESPAFWEQTNNKETTLPSLWPGIPTRAWKTTPMKLVRIGTGGPVEKAREFLLDHLDEFLDLYQKRPHQSNTCGMRLSHSLAIWTIAKRLQPTTIIESGINAGQSTYFFRKACPQAKIISIDPLETPICQQAARWIDTTNNEYMTGKKFTDFDAINWQERIANQDIDPATTLILMDDHQGFFNRMKTFVRYGFRHLINDDNYKWNEGATRLDKEGWMPKQMFYQTASSNAEWLFYNLKQYAEFPPLLSPLLVSQNATHAKKVQGGFLHPTDDLTSIEEPLLRPELDSNDRKVLERIALALNLDATMVDAESYQEFMGYCFICYLELIPLAPMLQSAWGLI